MSKTHDDYLNVLPTVDLRINKQKNENLSQRQIPAKSNKC